MDDQLLEGEIRFNNQFGEMLRLCPNGDIFVKGKLVENDKDVVDGMRALISGGKTL